MALPRPSDPYDEYTDQLVYFAARLAANPTTAALAQEVEQLLVEVDQEQTALRDARREEVRKRAVRDQQDDHGDTWATRLQRRVSAIVDPGHFVRERLFPRGVKHITAPVGFAQVERLRKLDQSIDEVLQSQQLAADPDAAELTDVLQAAKASGQQQMAALEPKIVAWNAQAQVVVKAQNAFNFIRKSGVDRLGATMGKLRTLLGGSQRDAYTYTMPRRNASGANNATDAPADDAPADPTPTPAE